MKKLLLLAVMALSMALVSCGGKANTPEDAAKKFADALVDLDTDGIVDMLDLSEEDKVGTKKILESALKMSESFNVKTELVKISEAKVVKEGQEADFDITLKVTQTNPMTQKEETAESTQTFTTIKVGDEWKIKSTFPF